MHPANENIINNTFNGKLKLKQSCNLEKLKGEMKNNGFDYPQFIQDYSHDMCSILAFYLHDKYNLKIGAIRAIDQNDDNDTDYETVVHQYVYLSDDLILDGRGIDTEKAMLDYYKEASLFDDEEWDFMVDEDYEHEPSKKNLRIYDEHTDVFDAFLDLLGESIKSKIEEELNQKAANEEHSLSL